MDRGAWWGVVPGVTESQTGLNHGAQTHSDNSEASHSDAVFFNKISNDVSIIIT